tara:strand:+ start:2920 stop:3153 length:234 start_codon:yes stop_codon:yes gene_type:complete
LNTIEEYLYKIEILTKIVVLLPERENDLVLDTDHFVLPARSELTDNGTDTVLTELPQSFLMRKKCSAFAPPQALSGP